MKTKFALISALITGAGLSFVAAPAIAQTDAPNKPNIAETKPGGAVLTAPEFTSWDDIKNLTHEQKAEFAIGLQRLETKLDKQISELKDKRAKMKGENKEWDFAMRNAEDARAYLKSTAAETEKASEEIWLNQKDKLGRAWQSTQDALDRVKATTTQ